MLIDVIQICNRGNAFAINLIIIFGNGRHVGRVADIFQRVLSQTNHAQQTAIWVAFYITLGSFDQGFQIGNLLIKRLGIFWGNTNSAKSIVVGNRVFVEIPNLKFIFKRAAVLPM